MNRKYIAHYEFSELYKAISQDENMDIADFVAENVSLQNRNAVLYFPSKGLRDQDVDFSKVRTIVDLKKVNLSHDLNRHFLSINKLLPDAGIYIGCLESYYDRKRKIFNKLGNFLGYIIWIIDLIFNRVFPKLKLTMNLYELITNNRYKVISLAETLGRSVYSGFDVITYQYIGYKSFLF
ncbi:MAG: hypothetical protein HC905_28745 [Bacteroidales bacterium]|nr:hypothetical protein [Bacteroidales bacterium]